MTACRYKHVFHFQLIFFPVSCQATRICHRNCLSVSIYPLSYLLVAQRLGNGSMNPLESHTRVAGVWGSDAMGLILLLNCRNISTYISQRFNFVSFVYLREPFHKFCNGLACQFSQALFRASTVHKQNIMQIEQCPLKSLRCYNKVD